MDPQPSRTPNFKRFLLVGALLGFVAGAVLALVGPEAVNYSTSAAVGYIGALGAVIGLALGGAAGLIVDFVRHRSGPPA